MKDLSILVIIWLSLTCPAMAATFYVGPSASGDSSGSDASNLMAWATWKGSTRTSDTCYIVGMDSTISEDFYWISCAGYYAKYVQVYATYSVGFEFADYERIFQWANGDIGVIGPVDIVALTPAPTTADIGGTVDVHGTMVDPVASWGQSWHGKANGYEVAYNVGPDISAETPYTLTAGHTMVHSYGKTTTDAQVEYIQNMAALHAVSEVPSVLSFRPTYAGGSATKTIHAASEVNMSLLANLTAHAGGPSKSSVEASVRQLWPEKIISYTNRCIHPSAPGRDEYGTYLSSYFAVCALWTNTNESESDKTFSVRCLVQAGIDLWGMIKSNSDGVKILTPDNGGHGQSKLRWAYAAWLLEDATMLAGLEKTGDYILTTSDDYHYWPSDYIVSSESQAYTVTADNVITPPWPVGHRNLGSGTGTVTVTNGSTTVTGSGTSWAGISATYCNMFAVVTAGGYADDDLADDVDAHAYYVASVESDTQLTLSSAYTGPNASGKNYKLAAYLCYGHGAAAQIQYLGVSEDTREFTAESVGLPVWGICWGYGGYYSPNISYAGDGWYTASNQGFDHRYQPTFVQAVAGNALCALAMGMRDDWNHDTTFEYADRVCTVQNRDSDFWYSWLRYMWEDHRASYSPVWTPKCHTPVPAHSATAIETSQVLSWYDGNGRASGTSCNVYFGTDSTPDETELVDEESTDYAYTPTLAAGTTYYWRVDEVCPGGTYTGDVWSFTTEGEEPEPPAGTKYLLIRKD